MLITISEPFSFEQSHLPPLSMSSWRNRMTQANTVHRLNATHCRKEGIGGYLVTALLSSTKALIHLLKVLPPLAQMSIVTGFVLDWLL
jgi:hypothetical protein